MEEDYTRRIFKWYFATNDKYDEIKDFIEQNPFKWQMIIDSYWDEHLNYE